MGEVWVHVSSGLTEGSKMLLGGSGIGWVKWSDGTIWVYNQLGGGGGEKRGGYQKLHDYWLTNY